VLVRPVRSAGRTHGGVKAFDLHAPANPGMVQNRFVQLLNAISYLGMIWWCKGTIRPKESLALLRR
jgi:hypothetical protein